MRDAPSFCSTYDSKIPEAVDGDLSSFCGDEGAVEGIAVRLTPPLVHLKVLHRQRTFGLEWWLQGGRKWVWLTTTPLHHFILFQQTATLYTCILLCLQPYWTLADGINQRNEQCQLNFSVRCFG